MVSPPIVFLKETKCVLSSTKERDTHHKREATELRSGDFLKNAVLELNCCHRWAAANTVGTWRGAGPLAVI